MTARKTVILRVFYLILAVTSAFGQAKGAIFDEEIYNNLPRTAALAANFYEGLPSSFSLKKFAPLPGDQNDFGTCVACAGYAARTIIESVTLNRLNQTESTQNAFSPVFIYKAIMPDDPKCIRGTQIHFFMLLKFYSLVN